MSGMKVGKVLISICRSAIFAEELEFPAHVIRVGYISDEQLRALYEGAACFVFPSLYEGFGSPPVEALSLGCPVVAAAAAALPEVLSTAAVYFRPTDWAAIADCIREAV